jgi:hypothetical protein
MKIVAHDTVIRNSVEATSELLASNRATDLLEERAGDLLLLLDRILPITINEAADQTPGLNDPDALPLGVVRPLGSIIISKGNLLQTSRQRAASIKLLDRWGAAQSGEQALTQLLAHGVPPGVHDMPISYVPKAGVAAAAVGHALALSSKEVNVSLDFARPPHAMLTRVSLRPGVFFNMLPEADRIGPDLLAHELTHVDQKERRAITLFSSQTDADMVALGDELEAYHVGAQVRMLLEGYEGKLEDYHGQDPYLQIAVERIRKQYNGTKSNDQFNPSRKLFTALARASFAPERMLDTRVDFDGIMRQLRAMSGARAEKALPPKAKSRKGSRTTPKK